MEMKNKNRHDPQIANLPLVRLPPRAPSLMPAVDLSVDLDTPAPARRAPRPSWEVYAPLIYAPALPLLRLALNRRASPTTRDRVFGVAVLCALAHAGKVMASDSTMGTSGAV